MLRVSLAGPIWQSSPQFSSFFHSAGGVLPQIPGVSSVSFTVLHVAMKEHVLQYVSEHLKANQRAYHFSNLRNLCISCSGFVIGFWTGRPQTGLSV